MNEVFAKCTNCPEKVIKREVISPTQKKKEIKKGGVSAERLQKKIIRKEPPISTAKTPFLSSASYILKKESEITLPDGTFLKLIKPEDLKPILDLP